MKKLVLFAAVGLLGLGLESVASACNGYGGYGYGYSGYGYSYGYRPAYGYNISLNIRPSYGYGYRFNIPSIVVNPIAPSTTVVPTPGPAVPAPNNTVLPTPAPAPAPVPAPAPAPAPALVPGPGGLAGNQTVAPQAIAPRTVLRPANTGNTTTLNGAAPR